MIENEESLSKAEKRIVQVKHNAVECTCIFHIIICKAGEEEEMNTKSKVSDIQFCAAFLFIQKEVFHHYFFFCVLFFVYELLQREVRICITNDRKRERERDLIFENNEMWDNKYIYINTQRENRNSIIHLHSISLSLSLS